MYYKWSKSFLEAGESQLNGDTIREASSNEVKELREENDLSEDDRCRADHKHADVKKNLEGFGIRIHQYMKYTQSEKMEIIRMVEESPLSVKQTLEKMGSPRSSFLRMV